MYHRLLNKTKHLDDISTDECLKITSSEIDDDIITTQELTGDSDFFQICHKIRYLKTNIIHFKAIKCKTSKV